MHPAFSVIFFTTASGAGFGLFAWIGWIALTSEFPNRSAWGIALAVGAVFAVAGLLSSLAHLGKPTRAWRAFGQWRSSWLSREGVLATACLLVALWLGFTLWKIHPPAVDGMWNVPTTTIHIAGALLLALSLATIVCTAMIYASLKPIPAWRHPFVIPVYLAFAAYTGYLLGAVALSSSSLDPILVITGAVLVLLLKLAAWRYVDRERVPISRNSALGLPHARPVQVFERPHTEANYLLKEMGYVLARKHARKLRLIAMLLFSAIPAALALLLWLLGPEFAGGVALVWLALASALAGALVERWLFFAEARHLVTLYY